MLVKILMNKHFYTKVKVPVVFTGSFAIILMIVLPSFVMAQSSIKAEKGKRIEILNSNSFEYDETSGLKAKKLIGDVRLKHDDALMFCDSAYVYSESNTMDAYGNVKILQGDSLQLYGDSLKYDGNTKKAILRGNIRLVNTDVELTTKYLDYDRVENVAYYYDGGTMVSRERQDTLTSKKGYYYSNTQSFYFKEDVVLNNPEYDIVSDTMKFNSSTETVYFLGPTTINSEENFIYTENGWYNTKTNISTFFSNSYIYSDNKIIEGDTLYYERDNGYGEITCNATITDTVENLVIGGDLVHLFEKKDSVMVTKEALLSQFFDADTLYLHADTFKVSSQIIKKELLPSDTLLINGVDSNSVDTVRNLYAYNHVKFFKSDMQGKADSVVYNFSDSTVNFYNDPVIWSKENQLTADFIYLLISKGKIHSIHMNQRAFIISKADSVLDNFNQIKGKNMVGYFKEQELRRIDVKLNAETIYYPKDDDEKYIGVNKAQGENMRVILEDRTLKTLTFIKDPEGVLYPLNEPSPKELILKGFSWRINEQPKEMFDVFIK